MRTHTTTTTLYTFDELSPEAKEKAVQTLWDINVDAFDWWDFVFEDAKTIAALFGLEINEIYFSGFSSQGDGACFEGWYRYKTGGLKAVKDYAPQDKALHDIVLMLQQAQVANFYQVFGTISHRGHYYHSGCMSFDLEDNRNRWNDIKDEGTFRDAFRYFADWIYERLENEYGYLTGEEAIIETIRANEYEFTEDGQLF